MPKKIFPFRHICFLLFVVLAQSQLGLGLDHDVLPASFTAISSLYFRPGTDYKVFFTVDPHPSNEPLQLKCVLMAHSNNRLIIESEPIFLSPGESSHVIIPLPREMPGNETTWRLFTWSITDDISTDGYLYLAPHTLIVSSELPNREHQSLPKAKLAAVFIQTDKPAYKPDDLVRIRVITMGSDDLPHLTAGVNLTITDSHGNVMKKWEQPLELPASAPSNISTFRNGSVVLFGEFQKKTNGLSAYEYQLSSEPILGNWTIEMQAGNIKKKLYFDVKKYILPKFQVKIHVPPVLYGTGDITAAATIKASYTYGKGLQGNGTLNVTSDSGAASKVVQFVVKDGEEKVQLTFSSSQGYTSTLHTITANVTEKNTGRWQIGKATIRIFPQETYNISWINKPSLYKPGLPMTVRLKVTGQDGFPVNDRRPDALVFSSYLNPPNQQTYIPLSGIVTFSFLSPVQQSPNNPDFKVKYRGHTHNFPLPPAEKGTFSGIYIDVIPSADSAHLLQGKLHNFIIKSNKPIQPKLFHCLLWDDVAMEVLGAQLIENNNNNDDTEFPFPLQLPNGFYTNLKVFVYFERVEGRRTEIISTFKSINTHNYLKIRVSRPIPKEAPTPAPGINNSNVAGCAESTTIVAPCPAAPVETTAAPSKGSIATGQETSRGDQLVVEPGDAVDIHFETYPDSTIAIRGIDHSLLLLADQDNDLNPEKLEEKRLAFLARKLNLDKIPTDNSCFLQTFSQLGIAILSSKRFNSFAKVGGVGVDDPPEESEIAPENAIFDRSIIPRKDFRLRTEFPETWLWEEFQSSSNSSSTVLSKTIPDTLTSWIITGFSLNSKTGLGVASPVTITGFMQFFVTLKLPYSVMKQEAFKLQVIVHNYLDRNVTVFVTLHNKQKNPEFSFVDDREKRNGNATRLINVVKDHVAVADFVIKPQVIGDIEIKVKAVTEDGLAGDSMTRFLKVKPEGLTQSRTQLVVFNRPETGDKNLSREASFDVEFPKTKVVGGSNSVQLTVIGDPMGTMMANLRNLLTLPDGCGEQNMLRFVPNVLALDYLSAINSGDKQTIEQAKINLQNGYSHQIQYKKSNGAFSVFKGESGTVWLTSYVLKWFIVAQKYITIDLNVITGAVSFIRSNQHLDGSFVDPGPRYHPEMCRSCAHALTAYITLALITANQTSNHMDLSVPIRKGMDFISQDAVFLKNDNYMINLVTATLMAGNHPEKNRFFEKMEKQAKTTTTKDGIKLKYWGMKNSTERANDPLAIEMTSYALLAHLWKKGTMDGSVLDIHRWLLNQRNPQGGFESTHDTAMGLIALTEFAIRTKGNVTHDDWLQLNITARNSTTASAKGTEFSHSVGRVNRMVLDEFTLPWRTKKVKINARGSGPAFFQLTETWNKIVRPGVTDPQNDLFNITAKMTIPDEEEPNEAKLELCVNPFTTSREVPTVASIELPTGYEFEPWKYEDESDFMGSKPEALQSLNLIEGNTKMEFQYSSIPAYPPTCVMLPALRTTEVANAKTSLIRVYDYYDPEEGTSFPYFPAHIDNECQLCKNLGVCHPIQCNPLFWG